LSALRYRTVWLAAGWLLVMLVIYLSVTSRPLEIPLEEGDKLGHLAAYATLMMWFGQLYAGRRRVIAFLGFIALGVALEYVQRATGYRSFDWWDMAADAAGTLSGLVLCPPRLPNVLAMVERCVRPRA